MNQNKKCQKGLLHCPSHLLLASTVRRLALFFMLMLKMWQLRTSCPLGLICPSTLNSQLPSTRKTSKSPLPFSLRHFNQP